MSENKRFPDPKETSDASNIPSDMQSEFNHQNTALHQFSKSIQEQFAQASKNLSNTFSIPSGIMLMVSKTKEAISQIIELDRVLVKIGKKSHLTTEQLKELGMSAYDSANKYGLSANEYLMGVQRMAEAGFHGTQGKAMAEQSFLAQAAGEMDAALAEQYILTNNAAFKLNGNAEKMNEILDGQTMVCSRSGISLANMADAMNQAGIVASGYSVSVEELTALLGTMEAVTKAGGKEVGNAAVSILNNLQNLSSNQIADTLAKAHTSMTEFVDGAKKLRNPIDIIRDLANTFNQLDEHDPFREEILTNIAGSQAPQLAAVLQNVSMMDKMLVDYSNSSGFAMNEAQTSANSLSDAVNKVSNSWTELINTFINTDEIINAANMLHLLMQTATDITDKLGFNGTVGVGAGLFAGLKNVGMAQ